MKHIINCIPSVLYLALIPSTLRGDFDDILHESIVLLLVLAALQSLYPVLYSLKEQLEKRQTANEMDQ